jgi:hypothetical protein
MTKEKEQKFLKIIQPLVEKIVKKQMDGSNKLNEISNNDKRKIVDMIFKTIESYLNGNTSVAANFLKTADKYSVLLFVQILQTDYHKNDAINIALKLLGYQ